MTTIPPAATPASARPFTTAARTRAAAQRVPDMQRNTPLLPTALLLLAACGAASAHVLLPPGGAAAGSTYAAAFKVAHACEGAHATTALRVELPKGFAFVSAQPRPGWTLASSAQAVTWTAANAQAALPGTSPESFVVTGKLPSKPGTLWFHVLQTCDVGSADWAATPSAADPKPKFPAPHLDVLAPGVAAVDVRDAWARPTVPGQTSSGIFGRLAAPSGARLVDVTTPVGDAAIHEMKMDGNVMRMRELDNGVALPAGQTVELKPGGYHVMFIGLKAPFAKGQKVPATLVFEKAGKVDVEFMVDALGATEPSARH
jgi:copper(I)-binding protein